MFSHITKDFFGNKFSIAVGLVFIAIGLCFGSWATFIPSIKNDFKLDDGQLGILLLSIPFGALSTNPVAAFLIKKVGMRFTTIFGIAILMIGFGLIMNTSNFYLLPLVMFLCGTGISMANVGVNTCVGAVEHQLHITIMSTCHGMFSMGLMIGSLMASFSNGNDILPGRYMLLLILCIVISMIWAVPLIYKIVEEPIMKNQEKSKFKFPTGSFLLMIIISLCINITEGCMADWSAVYMREVVNTNAYFIGWGMASYSFFMAFGRFTGDKIIPKYGANTILVGGGILAIIGILIIIFLPYTISAIVGFAIVGAGVSCGAPILYSSAARVPNMAKGSGLAILNTFAMGGFLFGPVLIGVISRAFSLALAFGLIAALGLLWVYQSKKVVLY